jgi:hypothetical protein
MEKLLTNLPIDYLQHLYEQKMVSKGFKINGKDVYQDENLELYMEEKFKKHPNTGLYISNYGRIKSDDKIKKQLIEKDGYLYTEVEYDISLFDDDLENKKTFKYCTPSVAYKKIQIDNEVEIKYRERYDSHPFLPIHRTKKGILFSRDYYNNKYIYKIFTSPTKNQFILIPIYIYRLVAETWLANPDPKEYTQVHHIINNGYNNTVFNLLWVTDPQHKIIEKRNWKGKSNII